MNRPMHSKPASRPVPDLKSLLCGAGLVMVAPLGAHAQVQPGQLTGKPPVAAQAITNPRSPLVSGTIPLHGTARGGKAIGGSATGGSATGNGRGLIIQPGTATPGTAHEGYVDEQGNAYGGSATGGSATGGSVRSR